MTGNTMRIELIRWSNAAILCGAILGVLALDSVAGSKSLKVVTTKRTNTLKALNSPSGRGKILPSKGNTFYRADVEATMSEGDTYRCLYDELTLAGKIQGKDQELKVQGHGDDKNGFVLGSAGSASTGSEKAAKNDEKVKLTLIFVIPDGTGPLKLLYNGKETR
jgi:hypothetical protein